MRSIGYSAVDTTNRTTQYCTDTNPTINDTISDTIIIKSVSTY